MRESNDDPEDQTHCECANATSPCLSAHQPEMLMLILTTIAILIKISMLWLSPFCETIFVHGLYAAKLAFPLLMALNIAGGDTGIYASKCLHCPEQHLASVILVRPWFMETTRQSLRCFYSLICTNNCQIFEFRRLCRIGWLSHQYFLRATEGSRSPRAESSNPAIWAWGFTSVVLQSHSVGAHARKKSVLTGKSRVTDQIR